MLLQLSYGIITLGLQTDQLWGLAVLMSKLCAGFFPSELAMVN